jgi:hypothetical protein
MSKMSEIARQEAEQREGCPEEHEHDYDIALKDMKAAEECIPVNEDKLFADHLLRTYGDIDICGQTYIAGFVLQKYAPFVWESMQKDWLSKQTTLCKIGGSWYQRSDIEIAKTDIARQNWIGDDEQYDDMKQNGDL